MPPYEAAQNPMAIDLKTFQNQKPLTRKLRRHDTFDSGA